MITNLSLIEKKALKLGKTVIGCDECNVCSYVGPVIVAAVKIPLKNKKLIPVNDSKKLSEDQIKEIAKKIKQNYEWVVKEVSLKDVDNHKLLIGEYKVIKKLVSQLKANVLLMDYHSIPELTNIWQIGVKNGDELCWSIAAASIIAKDYWNKWCYRFHEKYPEYKVNKNKGSFGNQLFNLTTKYGLTKYHRVNWIKSTCLKTGLNANIIKARKK